jgi:ABC-2 type transport system permease protein
VAIHTDKLRWLFWLRWKLLLRGFSRGAGRTSTIISTIILTLLVLIGGSSLAVITFLAYRFASAPINISVLVLVLTGVYIFWIIAPLMQVSTNEGLDVSKLTLFPLTRGELVASLLLSTLLDIWTLFLIFLFGAVVVGWAFSIPVLLMTLLTVLVFYVQVVGFSQLVLALLSGMVQNRRLRDLSVILVLLVGGGAYLCQFFFFRGNNITHTLGSGALVTYLQWVPPGMAARAIQQAALGNWEASFVWLLVLAAISLLALYLWLRTVERALASPEVGGSLRVRRRHVEQAYPVTSSAAEGAAPSSEVMSRLVAPQVLAIARKDLKYYRRDPQYLRVTVMPLLYVFVLVISTVFGGGNAAYAVTAVNTGQIFNLIRPMIAPAYILLSLFTLAYNTLGFEGQSLTTLSLFPIKPKHILLGKNLVIFLLGLVELIIVVLMVAFISHTWLFALPSFTLGLAGVLIVLALGNITSIYFPQRVRLAQRGFQSTNSMSAQGGCMRVVMSFAAMIVDVVVLIPVLAAMVLPIAFHATWLWVFAIPLSLAYGALIYYATTSIVAPRMLYRLPEILEVVARES